MHSQNQVTVSKNCLGRLKKRPEFLAVNATRQKWVSDTVIVQLHPQQSDFKFGVTATKKIGNAVIRNRCKRRLRAAIRHIATDNSFAPVHIVMIARADTSICDWDKLVKDLGWCLKRLEIIA